MHLRRFALFIFFPHPPVMLQSDGKFEHRIQSSHEEMLVNAADTMMIFLHQPLLTSLYFGQETIKIRNASERSNEMFFVLNLAVHDMQSFMVGIINDLLTFMTVPGIH